MAAPNIVNVATITGKTTYLTPAVTTASLLLANAASSGKVFKINSIIASNIDGTNNYDATVAINSNAAGSGTSYQIGPAITVPAKASLVVSDKSTAFYLEEDRSIVVTSSTASKITYIVSYEEIS
jgi:hypothetical protein